MFLIHEYAAAALAALLLTLLLLALYVVGYVLRAVAIMMAGTIQRGIRGAMAVKRSVRVRQQASGITSTDSAVPIAECAA
jgi:hypothetical protein